MTRSKTDIRRQAMLHYYNQHLYTQGLISEQERNQLKLNINTRYAPKSKPSRPVLNVDQNGVPP